MLVAGSDVFVRLAAPGKKYCQALLIGAARRCCAALSRWYGAALWRGGDVILGSLLAMLFTGIWPQRAFCTGAASWRIASAYNQVYQQAALSPNLRAYVWMAYLQRLLNDVVKVEH